MQSNRSAISTTMNSLVNYGGGGDGDGDGDDKLSDAEYLMRLPPGFRFRPTDKECILEFLMKKINNQPLPPNPIYTAELYAQSPDHLTNIFPPSGEGEWFFFSPREKKYQRSKRPDRAAGDGRWKATSSDCDIFHNGTKIGSRKVLAYMKGGAHLQGTKTDWLMHEFRVVNSTTTQENSMRLDDWVLCRVYKRGNRRIKSSRKRNREEEVEDGGVNDIMAYNEAVQVQPYVASSVATISGPSFDVLDLPLPSFPQEMPNFPSDYHHLHGQYGQQGYDQFNVEQHHLPQPHVQHPYPFSCQPSYSSSSHSSCLLPMPYRHRQEPAFNSVFGCSSR